MDYLRLSTNPAIPIFKRHIIPAPAKKACLYIFSLSSASLFSKYLIRYCVICTIFSIISALFFIRFITSLSIVNLTPILYPPYLGIKVFITLDSASSFIESENSSPSENTRISFFLQLEVH